jgi:hypothetical protein
LKKDAEVEKRFEMVETSIKTVKKGFNSIFKRNLQKLD